MKFLVAGGYDTQNLGDYASFLGLYKLFKSENPEARFTVLSRHPNDLFSQQFDVRTIINLDHANKNDSLGRLFLGFNEDDTNEHLSKFIQELINCDCLLIGNGRLFINIATGLSLIEHVHTPSTFLSEVKRILKPDGVLWMDTLDINACGTAFWNDPTHVSPYTRKSFRLLVEMKGFTNVLITPNYHCKPLLYYKGLELNFFMARRIMQLKGDTSLPMTKFFKGKCSGLFCLAMK